MKIKELINIFNEMTFMQKVKIEKKKIKSLMAFVIEIYSFEYGVSVMFDFGFDHLKKYLPTRKGWHVIKRKSRRLAI